MMMDDVCIKLINQEKKSETRRIKRNNRRPAVPGHVHLLKKDRTKNVYGKILITDVYIESSIYDVSEESARKEGFPNREEFIKYWLSVNNNYAGEEIWVVEFIILGGSGFSEEVGKKISKTYLKYYKNISFKKYMKRCIYQTTTRRIKKANEKYVNTINELCETGEAIYVREKDDIIFLNWDVCYKKLIRNFAIVW